MRYAIIRDDIIENVVIWDGDPARWSPPGRRIGDGWQAPPSEQETLPPAARRGSWLARAALGEWKAIW